MIEHDKYKTLSDACFVNAALIRHTTDPKVINAAADVLIQVGKLIKDMKPPIKKVLGHTIDWEWNGRDIT